MLYFGAAQLRGLVSGNFGPKQDTEGQQAFREIRKVLESPDATALIEQAPDAVTIAVKGDWEHQVPPRSVSLKTQLDDLYVDKVDGIKDLRVSFPNIREAGNRVIDDLSRNLQHLAKLHQLNQRMQALRQAHIIDGLEFSRLLTGSGKRLGSTGVRAAELLTNLLEDPDIQNILNRFNDYKCYRLDVESTNADYDALLREAGIPEEEEYKAPYREKTRQVLTQAEPTRPDLFTLKINFRNMAFSFDPSLAQYEGDKEATRHGAVRFTLQELEQKPEVVKQRILDSQHYWNNKIAGYVD
jgi:hypothetical protein